MTRSFLLWDHDGVLVDTERWYFTATREALRALGVDLDQRTYLEHMAEGRTCWHLATDRGVSAAAVAEARHARDARYRELLLTRAIDVDGVPDVLAELGPRFRMAIVTTARRRDFDLIHRSRRIREFFEFVITIDDCTEAKPAPEPYLRALERFGAAPEQALAIEDSSRGLAAARAAGIDCAVVRNDFTATQDFTGAWRVLDSIRDLPAAL
jgi:HAD superfamily hydrolase (TIGR01509 family)